MEFWRGTPAHRLACARLRDGYGSLRTLAQSHPAELRDHGLTSKAVDKLCAVFEIARRYGEEEFATGQSFKGSYDVYAHFRERLAHERREHFIAVLLDNKNRKLRDVTIAVGSLTASIVQARAVYRCVILDAAAAVIFVHTHPSGDPTPSAEDVEITRRPARSRRARRRACPRPHRHRQGPLRLLRRRPLTGEVANSLPSRPVCDPTARLRCAQTSPGTLRRPAYAAECVCPLASWYGRKDFVMKSSLKSR